VAQKVAVVDHKKTKTSLIQQFLYPVHGPGQLWEEVAEKIIQLGGEICYQSEVTNIHIEHGRVVAVSCKNKDGRINRISCEIFFSTMPVKELIAGLDANVPDEVKEIASGLEYRDFITVGMLLKNFDKSMKDNWIYMHDPSVQFARIQIFNNWSEKMVANPSHTWVGLEYIVNKDDTMWHKPDAVLAADSRADLEKIGFIKAVDCIDSHVVRVEKAYPVYAGSYAHFGKVREYVNSIPNLILIGRNGMHRYNNQDHSMLTALTAVDMIVDGNMDHSKLWAINTDDEYQEEK
jgi:protoporphyrinogen oxidase